MVAHCDDPVVILSDRRAEYYALAPRKAAFGNWVMNWEIDICACELLSVMLYASRVTTMPLPLMRLVIQSDLVINYSRESCDEAFAGPNNRYRDFRGRVVSIFFFSGTDVRTIRFGHRRRRKMFIRKVVTTS